MKNENKIRCNDAEWDFYKTIINSFKKDGTFSNSFALTFTTVLRENLGYLTSKKLIKTSSNK
ncbi:MAG: hypothetical protein J5691_06200 [Bacilli bacterium]|nr:hypothetical protein [Bacilli bacterium]